MYLKKPFKELRLGEQLPTQREDDDFYDPVEPEYWLCFCGNNDRDRFVPCSSMGKQEDVDEYGRQVQSYWFPRWFLCQDCRRTIRTMDRRVIGVFVQGYGLTQVRKFA